MNSMKISTSELEHLREEVKNCHRIIESLKHSKQEPVKIVKYNCTCGKVMKFESKHGVVAPQRTWAELTQDEFEQLINDAKFTRTDLLMMGACVEQIVYLVENKLKEKNYD